MYHRLTLQATAKKIGLIADFYYRNLNVQFYVHFASKKFGEVALSVDFRVNLIADRYQVTLNI